MDTNERYYKYIYKQYETYVKLMNDDVFPPLFIIDGSDISKKDMLPGKVIKFNWFTIFKLRIMVWIKRLTNHSN